MLLIGLMSGTSADGIDAALVDIRGRGQRTRVRLIHHLHMAHERDMQQAILRLCDSRTGGVPELCVLNTALGEQFAAAAHAVAHGSGVSLGEVAAICSHGQTVWHQPIPTAVGGADSPGTLQIGEPAVIAARTGCTVVSGFRTADMAVGGQGAPLVPYADWVLLTSEREARVVLNIGGIANVTHLPRGAGLAEVLAFDTGPGNMVVDGLVRVLSNGAASFDDNGAWAASGSVHEALLAELLEHPYFRRDPPKTTGREEFGAHYIADVRSRAERRAVPGRSLLATATALTAETIARAFRHWLLPRGGAHTVVAGGGGTRNETLMQMLRDGLAPARLATHVEFGIPDEAKEAIAFALLGYETLHGRPSNVPSATGARHPVILGSITRTSPDTRIRNCSDAAP